MANMCSNIVEVTGRKSSTFIMNVMELYVPDAEFERDERGYIRIIKFETKWSPMIVEFRKRANVYGVDFIYQYEEMGYGLYGEYVYAGGQGKHFRISPSEFKQIVESEDGNGWVYKKKQWSSRYDIFDMILNRKKAIYYKLDA
jgi:hypothetical protein